MPSLADQQTEPSRPFYAIAHKVLTSEGVDAAIDHGCNALESDLIASSSGWYADHAGLPFSAGSKVEDLFAHIGKRRREGANVLFVWLDIKNPKKCDPSMDYDCSLHHLQDLARRHLISAGIRVLYGTYSNREVEKGACTRLTERGLHPAEAINIDNVFEDVDLLFDEHCSDVPIRQRIFAIGFLDWRLRLQSILRETKLAAESGKFAKTFAWTSIHKDSREDNIKRFITESKGDGLIFGGMLRYRNMALYAAPLSNIKTVVEGLPEVHMAQVSNGDWPW